MMKAILGYTHLYVVVFVDSSFVIWHNITNIHLFPGIKLLKQYVHRHDKSMSFNIFISNTHSNLKTN